MKKLIFCLALFPAAASALPTSLVIGYPNEGKVQATTAACSQVVLDTTGLTGADVEKPMIAVCAARHNHIVAYQELQEAYTKFSKSIGADNRLQVDQAVIAIKAVIKNCIAFNESLSRGGHGFGTDLIPNEIATRCLQLGTQLLDQKSLLYLDPQ